MVGEAPVHVAEEGLGRQAELLHAGHRHRAAGAVAGVDDEAEVGAGEANPAGDHVDVARVELDLLDPARGAPRPRDVALDALPQRLDVGAEEARLAAHHLEAVLVASVVTAGDHDAAVGRRARERTRRAWASARPRCRRRGAGAREAADERSEEAVARESTVAPDGDARTGDVCVEHRRERLPDPRGDAVGQVAVSDASNVVFAETLGGDLHGGATWRGRRPPRKSWLACQIRRRLGRPAAPAARRVRVRARGHLPARRPRARALRPRQPPDWVVPGGAHAAQRRDDHVRQPGQIPRTRAAWWSASRPRRSWASPGAARSAASGSPCRTATRTSWASCPARATCARTGPSRCRWRCSRAPRRR